MSLSLRVIVSLLRAAYCLAYAYDGLLLPSTYELQQHF